MPELHDRHSTMCFVFGNDRRPGRLLQQHLQQQQQHHRRHNTQNNEVQWLHAERMERRRLRRRSLPSWNNKRARQENGTHCRGVLLLHRATCVTANKLLTVPGPPQKMGTFGQGRALLGLHGALQRQRANFTVRSCSRSQHRPVCRFPIWMGSTLHAPQTLGGTSHSAVPTQGAPSGSRMSSVVALSHHARPDSKGRIATA